MMRQLHRVGLLLAAAHVLVGFGGCIELKQDGGCANYTYSDCWACGGLANSLYTCTDLQTLDVCRSVMINEQCHSGSTCETYVEDCDDICYAGRCDIVDTPFSGVGGLAVGYTLESAPQTARPVIMTTTDYGATWSEYRQLHVPPGCTEQRFEQMHFENGNQGWIRAVGAGPSCDAGLWLTDDGAQTWSWTAFPRTADGSPIGGGPILARGSMLLSGGLPAGVSHDHGQTWEPLPVPLDPGSGGDATPVSLQHFALLQDGGYVCASSAEVSRGGVYCASFVGAPFTRWLETAQPILMITDEWPNNNGLVVVVAGDPITLLNSADEGLTWVPGEFDNGPVAGNGAILYRPLADPYNRRARPEILITEDGYATGIVYSYSGLLPRWRGYSLSETQSCPQGPLRWPAVGPHGYARVFALGVCEEPGGGASLQMGYGDRSASVAVAAYNTAAVIGEPARWTGLVVGLHGQPITAP